MSFKRLQVVLSEEAWKIVESLTAEANNNFDVGTINYSNMINEMIVTSKVDTKALQFKHTDLRRSLRVMASKENIDLDSIMRTLNELKLKVGKRGTKSQTSFLDEVSHE